MGDEDGVSPVVPFLWDFTSTAAVYDLPWEGGPPGYSFPASLQRLVLDGSLPLGNLGTVSTTPGGPEILHRLGTHDDHAIIKNDSS